MSIRSDGTRAAFARIIADRWLRRLLASYGMYAMAEASAWVAVLVWAHQIGGVAGVGLLAGSLLAVAALVAPVAVSLVERLPRGKGLAAAHLVAALALGGAALAAGVDGGGSLWSTFSLLLLAVAAQSVVPPIHGASVPELAQGPTDLVAANVASVTVQGVAMFLGPGLAAVVMLAGGPEWVFAATAGLCLVGAVSAIGIRPRESAQRHRLRLGAALRLLGQALRDRDQRLLLALGGAEMVVVAALDVLVIVLALEVWRSEEAGAGLAAATLGIGSIIGSALAVSMVTRTRLLPPVLIGGAIRSAAMIGLAFSSGPVALVLVAIAGLGFSVIDVASKTLLQRTALPDALARVFGLFESLQVAGYAVGTFAAPLIADALGVPGALVAVGVLFPLGVVARLRALRRVEDSAIASADEVRLIRSSPLLGALSPPAQERLAHRGTWREVGSGQALIDEGASSDEVYVISEGSIEVSRNGQLVALLGRGDVVGEIAALRGILRTATAKAIGDVTVLSFAGPRFVEAVRGDGVGWSEADRLVEDRRRMLDEDE